MHPELIKPVKKVRGGVMVPHSKNTKDMPVRRIPAPEEVVLPMSQHIGAPCEPTVKVGDTVKVGQVVGDSDKYVSAPIHATVSGKVTAIKEMRTATGVVSQAVFIENDGEMENFEDLKPPKIDTREEFITAIRQSGLVGLGGAGFPTHVKLNFKPDAGIDTLVINAAECEPYITVDYRECIDNSWHVFNGIHLIKDMLGFKKVVIAVEDNKPEAIKILERIAEKDDERDEIKVMPLKSKYPQGAEKMMVLSATGRKVPPGKLPADVGCVVMNVASAAFIARYVRTGRPLVSRSLTVDGSAVATPQNVRVPVGTEIEYIIQQCGGYREDPVKIVTGGPMMGAAIVDTHHPILKSNNAILVLGKEDISVKHETDCIRCGRCAKACPLSLMPTVIERYAKARDISALNRSGAMVCMECGSCAFSCPAGRPLVQYMRNAKAIIKEEASK
ncbi:MAG: electron transport complex subunit RsxC [Clostridiaceae bacterium]|jgi:electron transport complex protein RnfC|nr:electron transport complex subunit RsxC [Clostridiaceae bacterium]